jgi:hypothetical protein
MAGAGLGMEQGHPHRTADRLGWARGPARTTLLAAVLILAVAPLALPSARAASSPAPTGDAEAIAFNRQVEQAYSMLPGVKMVQHGYLFARRLGRNGFSYQHGPAPRYRPATETFHYALSNGIEAAYSIRVVARGVGRFDVVGNSNGVYDSDLGGGGCWQKTSEVYGPPGEHFIALYGHYYPLKRRGSVVLSRWTSPYGRGSKFTDVDTIDPTTHQILSARIIVTGKQHLTVTQKITALSMAPTFPVPHVCPG